MSFCRHHRFSKQTRAIGLISYLRREFLTAIFKVAGTAAVDHAGEMSNPYIAQAADKPFKIETETLIQSTSSWDGMPYVSYPAGRPQITILRITIAPHTTMKWHTHPLPNAGYILSGELTIEREDGTKAHFVAGQAVTETVNSVHRGITGAKQTVLIVFYPGTPGLPLSQ
jgi:quercetin dioxygenase-like cupin family protein